MKKFPSLLLPLMLVLLTFGVCLLSEAQENENRKYIYVPQDYPTIQEAINAAENNDEIIVDTGIYLENLDFLQKRLFLLSHYVLTGDSTLIQKTIIDGGGNSSVVTVSHKQPERVEINGFTITNGTGNEDGRGGGIYLSHTQFYMSNCIITGNSARQGGGMFASGPTELFLENVLFIDNIAEIEGGGMRTFNTQCWFTNCSFEDNQVTDGKGGGLYYRFSAQSEDSHEVDVQHSRFINNSSTQSTGGAFFDINDNNTTALTITIGNCLFEGNTAAYHSGLRFTGSNYEISMRNNRFISNEAGTYVAGCGFTGGFNGRVYNSIFQANTAGTSGTGNAGGVSVYSNADIEFFNCVFSGNTAPEGAGLSVGGGGYSKLYMCISYNNTNDQIRLIDTGDEGGKLEVFYSDVQGGQAGIGVSSHSELVWGEGNSDQDPMFAGTGEDPLELKQGSPCIDAGFPEIFPWMNMPPMDIIGNIRVWDGGSGAPRIDIGAYEYGSEPMIIDEFISHNPKIIIEGYPNPFITSTTFEYTLEKPADVAITIYNTQGQVMERMQERQEKGVQRVEWRADGLPAGIYYFRIQAGDKMGSGKMVKMD